jgi:hypothetical protein
MPTSSPRRLFSRIWSTPHVDCGSMILEWKISTAMTQWLFIFQDDVAQIFAKIPRGSLFQEKLPEGFPYFGFYCIFINNSFEICLGGPIFTLPLVCILYDTMTVHFSGWWGLRQLDPVQLQVPALRQAGQGRLGSGRPLSSESDSG